MAALTGGGGARRRAAAPAARIPDMIASNINERLLNNSSGAFTVRKVGR